MSPDDEPPERHVLSRDRLRHRGAPPLDHLIPKPPPPPKPAPPPLPPTMTGNKNELAAKNDYLAILAALSGDIARAREAVRLPYKRLLRYRLDPLFALAERSEAGRDGVTWEQDCYLMALTVHASNEWKARRDAGVTSAAVANWQQDPVYKAREDDVYDSFRQGMNEQIVRAVTGRETTVRDWRPVMAYAGKIDARWKDEPKEINMRYSGNVTVQSLDEEILMLTSGDGD